MSESCRDSFTTPALTCGKSYNTVGKVHSVSGFHFKPDTVVVNTVLVH